tara:strand:- start:45 stop:695 length:651 start_codon:yes stop_codon:yes gene_type:complete
MPNDILRAGPFAGGGDSFRDKQDPLLVGRFADVNVYPVNCANHTSSSAWPWRYNHAFSSSLTTHTGCESTPVGDSPTTSNLTSNSGLVKTATGDFFVSNSATSNHRTRIFTGLSFAYQATESFDIKITYDGLASASAGQRIDTSSIILFDDTSTGGDADGFPSLSGSITRTLPASVVPAVYSATLGVSIVIEFPDDFCTPNPGSANASATLEIEFL